jgi:predicted carbohydrate-binding protein with CBM5 and CBM33 domain
MSDRQVPAALGLATDVPKLSGSGNGAQPIKWEEVVKCRDHPNKAALEYVFDSKSKATSRANAIKRRFRQVDNLANIVTRVRRVPDELAAKLKLDTKTEWFGVWVNYLGQLTEKERADLDAKAAQRVAARNQPSDDDAKAVAAAAAS